MIRFAFDLRGMFCDDASSVPYGTKPLTSLSRASHEPREIWAVRDLGDFARGGFEIISVLSDGSSDKKPPLSLFNATSARQQLPGFFVKGPFEGFRVASPHGAGDVTEPTTPPTQSIAAPNTKGGLAFLMAVMAVL